MLKRILIGIAVLLGLGALWIGGILLYHSQASGNPAFYESEIVAFEEADQLAFPALGGIVFFGSSSIRLWDTLLADMAPLPVTQRGFGGAHVEHLLHNVARVVLPYEPRAVVIFCGGNDVGAGKSVDRVVADYRTLLDQIHEALPETDVWILSMKPSKLRFGQWGEMEKIDAAFHAMAAADERVRVVDTGRTLLGADGTPDDVYVFDRLHLNAEGYRRWTALLQPLLMEAYGDAS